MCDRYRLPQEGTMGSSEVAWVATETKDVRDAKTIGRPPKKAASIGQSPVQKEAACGTGGRDGEAGLTKSLWRPGNSVVSPRCWTWSQRMPFLPSWASDFFLYHRSLMCPSLLVRIRMLTMALCIWEANRLPWVPKRFELWTFKQCWNCQRLWDFRSWTECTLYYRMIVRLWGK